jgi:hypothetical protein
MKKLISFWKQVREKSSDMFTLFRVGIGVKVPTHKLHVKDKTDPLKIEGLQNDATDPDKFLTIDASNVVKYRTGAQLASDIEVSIDDLHGAGVDGAANQLLTDDGDGTVTSEADLLWDNSTLTIGNDDSSTHIIKRADRTGTAGGGRLYLQGGKAVGVNQTGGAVGMYAGAGTGTGHSGNISFLTATGDAGSGSVVNNFNASSYFSGEDGSLNLSGKLKIDGNIIEDNDGVDCITFDSLGNTTILNTLNASLTGNVIGNTSGTAATVTAGAQPAITSLGTLSILAVDYVSINGSTISTGGGNDLTVSASGDLNLTANGNDINVDTDTFTITSATGIKPRLTLKATASSNKPSVLEFVKDKGIAGADGDFIADIYYTSDNDAQEQTSFVLIQGTVSDATDGAEEGKYNVRIKNTTGATPVDSFILEGNGANTDATIGYGSGSVTTIAGDLTVTGNDIKDSGGNSIISSDGSGVVTMPGGNINIDGSNANLNLNNGADILLGADAAGGTASTIQYLDSGSTGRYMLMAEATDKVVLCNRASNGTVYIRANTSTAGSGGEVTVATFEDDSITAAVPLFINAGGSNVAITCTSSDADCMVRVSDNSTAGTNVIGLVATGDDSIIRNDEGNFKVKMANNATTTLDLDQNGNLDITGNILPGITYVKILPSDFMPDDGGRPAMIDDTSGDRWLESHGTGKLFAFVQIPLGFKATLVDVYGSATSAVTVYEADVNSATVTSKGTGNIGTQINITDVTADATNYIMIELAQASGEKVYGGKMTIAKA